jgi:hypothetical protein
MRREKCIYCGEAIYNQTGEGDHVIPGVLGEFEDDIRFRGICPKCNNEIGKCEQVLVNCSPAAFFRRVVRPAAPPSRQRRGRSRLKAVHGVRTPTHVIEHGEHHLLADPLHGNELNGRLPDQLVIHDANGREYFFRLYSGMSAKKLKAQITATATLPAKAVWIHCDEDKMEEYKALMFAMFPQAKYEELPPTPAGKFAANACITCVMGSPHYRALAKIAFHYYLTHNRRGFRGDEPCFAPIRKFIMEGGDHSQFFREPPRPFAVPWGTLPDGKANASPATQWGHMLAADETSRDVFAYVQLFLGPGCIPDSYYLMLGTIDSPIIAPMSFVFAHVYVYHEQQPEVGIAGKVSAMTVTSVPAQQAREAGYFPAKAWQ